MQAITLRRPDDWHLHLRDGAALAHTVPATAAHYGRAIVMPNLSRPVTTVAEALAYRDRILAARPAGSDFEPLMTLYLTDNTEAAELRLAAQNPHIHAVKLYPAGATTNSRAGVTDLEALNRLIAVLEECDLPLLIHGEVTDPDVDLFDREQVFIDRHLVGMAARFPGLRIVLEHITTQQGIEFVRAAREGVAGTLTVHHLALERNDMFRGGLQPHRYCLPVLKRSSHRQALLDAATSGEAKFFLGTDSAPHPRQGKEAACGCAGCFTAPWSLAWYAQVFEAAGRLDRLEAFASLHGPRFYRLPVNQDQVQLCRQETQVPADWPLGSDRVVPPIAGETLHWKVQ